VAVLNVDDPLVAAMAARTTARVVTVGCSPVAHVRAVDVALDPEGRPSFRLVRGEESADVAMGLYGAHHVGNALATAAVALELGLGLVTVAEALGAARPASRWRMEVTSTPSGVTVVNDAYNANPESVRAALEALVAMSRPTPERPRRRSWAVLGEMRELGEASSAEHAEVGRVAVRLGVDLVVAVGAGAEPVRSGAVLEGGSKERLIVVPDVEAAVALLRHEVVAGDVVLVKASRSVGLERVATALLESPA
jgi:UDP-N-acetylmuramoyl-tripeptide--D-alanyl-D-alanine ligase